MKNEQIQIKDESISVSQLNKLAKLLLENNMPICWIKGEVSGIKSYNHVYFDLKDEGAKISCVMFASFLSQIDFKMENGIKVEVRGKVTVYPQNGSYQINVERVRQVGMGELWEAYHRLLAKLRAEGIFDVKHKKPIPVFPRVIGVITSKEGAVIRDVVTTLKRRMPNITIIVYHTAVQGQDAAMQITKAIKTANKRKEVDVIIICRGGGSQEDLWCFNEEVVVREVFASMIPIISAIGHETDTTITDHAADLRAPTPTAAAELVSKAKQEWSALIGKLHGQLVHKFEFTMNDCKQKLDLYYRQLRILNPVNQLRERYLLINGHTQQLVAKLTKIINQKNMHLQILDAQLQRKQPNIFAYFNKLQNYYDRLENVIKARLTALNRRLDNLHTHLNLLNPHNILSRGYAIVKVPHGQVVYKLSDVKHHQRVEIVLQHDVVSAIIDKKHHKNQMELLE